VKIIGYTRVSTAEQAKDGWTLAQQRKAIEAEAERRGWTLVEVIEDAGYSGTNEDRPGLQRALRMLKARQAQAIMVARLDRLARSTQHLCEYIAACKKQKWQMVALDVGLDTTSANGRFMVRVLAAVAEWESEVNGERVREGMAEARASGKRFGFQRQASAEAVTRIVRARKRGEPFHRIAARLDRQGVPTPGGGARWYPSTVARIYKAAS